MVMIAMCDSDSGGGGIGIYLLTVTVSTVISIETKCVQYVHRPVLTVIPKMA